MKLVPVSWLPSVYAGKRTRAITISPYVFILKEYVDDVALLAHEQVHLDQVKLYGWWTFYWRYITSPTFRWQMETEGYAKQRAVEQELKDRYLA